MTAVTHRERTVLGTVDAGGLYCSRLAATPNIAFLAGGAFDGTGRLAADAQVAPPYHLSAAAHARRQTFSIYDDYRRHLAELGATLDDIVQVEQYIQRKEHADQYLTASRAPGYLEHDRPTSACVVTGPSLPTGGVLDLVATAVLPGQWEKEIVGNNDETLWRPEWGESYVRPLYNRLVLAGPYVFSVGDVAMGNGEAINPAARLPDWVWWGNETRSEAGVNLAAFEETLGLAGTTLDQAVRATVMLTDPGDLYELDLLWRQAFPDDPPARTVIPIAGLCSPRKEVAQGHGENALRYESMFQSIRPGHGVTREVIGTGAETIGHCSEAVRTGDMLWISGRMAGGSAGLASAPGIRHQLEHIFGGLADVCAAGGTGLENLVQLRAYVTDVEDGYAVHAALREAVPSNPPAVLVTQVPGPLLIPGATVVVDAVAYVPGRD